MRSTTSREAAIRAARRAHGTENVETLINGGWSPSVLHPGLWCHPKTSYPWPFADALRLQAERAEERQQAVEMFS